MRTVPLKIITPEKVFYSHEVRMIVCGFSYGKEGFLPGHSYVVKPLPEGSIVRITETGENGGTIERAAEVDGGHLTVTESFSIFTSGARWITGNPDSESY